MESENRIRLQKYLADCGIASRRAAEVLIGAGRVTVNGQVGQIGDKVLPGADEVCLDGKTVALREGVGFAYIALHKPVGVISSAVDQFGRPVVTDLVGDGFGRLFPVGRLDYASTGLILLTNDGEIANKLTHPRFSVEKIYEARLRRPLDGALVSAFRQGVVVEGKLTRPADLEIIGRDKQSAKICLKEGRNRQIRKMFEVLGNEVVALKRVAIGRISLGELDVGKYRKLTAAEIEYLRQL